MIAGRQVEPRRGEIWSVRLPNQPDDPHQPRPALIISPDSRNRIADDVIVIQIFHSGPPGPTHVPIPRGAGGIRDDSVLFCEEVATLDVDFLHNGPFGDLVDEALLAQVLIGVRRALGDRVTLS